MNEQLEIRRVPFLGADLMAARDNNGQIWAGVRWMCDGIGLNRNQRDNQIQKIKSEKVLSKGAGNFPLPTDGGSQETLCLKLDFVPLWLAKIAITPKMEKETPELADRLEQYQLRAKDILAAAFLPSALSSQTLNRRPVEVSPGGMAKLILANRRVMLDMGCTFTEVGAATKVLYEVYGIPVPVAFSRQIPGQLCLFDSPALIEGR